MRIRLIQGTLFLAVLLLSIRWMPALAANLDRVAILTEEDGADFRSGLDEASWDDGWRRLCAGNAGAPTASPSVHPGALPFAAAAHLDRGDFSAALALYRQAQSTDTDSSLVAAYTAALNLEWAKAADLYDFEHSGGRHRRFWGTVSYLAAQQASFSRDSRRADALYRQANDYYWTDGPYAGMALVDCLERRGRFLEAYDAYRRALATVPPENALNHLPRFNQLRLRGLQEWQRLDPNNRQVSEWLQFHENDVETNETPIEQLPESAAEPQVRLNLRLDDRRSLIGFDYRPDDIETGPFMDVLFYLRRAGDNGERYVRVQKTVFNQTANGAFRWDAVPDGVQPVGWHHYPPHERRRPLPHLDWRSLDGDEGRWLCLDGALGDGGAHLEAVSTTLLGGRTYVQGATTFLRGEGRLSLGRRWAGGQRPRYSYAGHGHRPNEFKVVANTWQPPAAAHSVTTWLIAHQRGAACFRDLYLFALPDFKSAP